MIKFIEETDKGLFAISPLGLLSPFRFCVSEKDQLKKCKRVERLIVIAFVTYCLKIYHHDYDGLDWMLPAWLGFAVANVLYYVALWIYVPKLKLYKKSVHGSLKKFL